MSVRTVTQPVSGLGLKGSITLQERRIRFVRAVNRTARIRSRLRGAATTAGVTVLSALAIFLPPTSNADPDPAAPPSDSDLLYAFPAFTPTPSNWKPKFPFPYDQTRDRVTPADITAMAEMCQWYNRQYATLRDQIDRIQFNRIDSYGKDFDYNQGDIQQQVDIVTGNIDKSLAFLDPRVHALTIAQNSFGDNYFPIYEGEQFFKLYEQLVNVSNGIKAHQPDWFTGPSVQKAKRHGSDIFRSHVCD
ncbi:hypothetical protein JMUB5695_03992 [Mycobacterium heckeshornense]|uniref:Uncharacterized protein n=1 Tax=Mycobacterium heckeshornense TaxID=110505 RepID=A0A7R7U088_9MYCO|nr:hypothetical protein MHEC_41170 [Mycobacterium heckeshornense]BCQ10534.1 hypothetical protein JMUB5695_03992 [Mycobacterium heckeshornense]